MQYVRSYSDESGESHFEDVYVVLIPSEFAPPAPPLDLSPFTRAVAVAFLGIPAGWFGDWHPAPRRQIFFILSGNCEVTVSDGQVRAFGPGSVYLMEDTTGKGHITKNVDNGEVLTAVVQLGD